MRRKRRLLMFIYSFARMLPRQHHASTFSVPATANTITTLHPTPRLTVPTRNAYNQMDDDSSDDDDTCPSVTPSPSWYRRFRKRPAVEEAKCASAAADVTANVAADAVLLHRRERKKKMWYVAAAVSVAVYTCAMMGVFLRVVLFLWVY